MVHQEDQPLITEKKENQLTLSPPYASRTYIWLLVVVKSIDLPSLLNLMSETSAVSPPTKKVSNGPWNWI